MYDVLDLPLSKARCDLEKRYATNIAVAACCRLKVELLQVLVVPEIKVLDAATKKECWDLNLSKIAKDNLKIEYMSNELCDKVLGLMHLIGMRMLHWAEYHETKIGFTRRYSMSLFVTSHFTEEGIIDQKKVVQHMMEDKRLGVQQRYKIACMYCLPQVVKMHKEVMINRYNTENFYDYRNPKRIRQSDMVKFWTFHLIGDKDRLDLKMGPYQYRLEKAIDDGNPLALANCLQASQINKKKRDLKDLALSAVSNWVAPPYLEKDDPNTKFDWVVFGKTRNPYEQQWIPTDFYLDLLHSLLFRMTETELIEFLKADCEEVGEDSDKETPPAVLECLLNWPYQDYFMTTVRLMWEFLPPVTYSTLFTKICEKMSAKRGDLKYGEETFYDYKELLKDFWTESPDRFKRQVFKTQLELRPRCPTRVINAGAEALSKIFALYPFTRADVHNILLILKEMKDDEKQHIIHSVLSKEICIELIRNDKIALLEQYLSYFFTSKDDICKFANALCYLADTQSAILFLLGCEQYGEVDDFLAWCCLSDKELSRFKRVLIWSVTAWQMFLNYFPEHDETGEIDELCDWCFESQEELRLFKDKLLLSSDAEEMCIDFILYNCFRKVDMFLAWCLPSEEAAVEFRKSFAWRHGGQICETLLSNYEKRTIHCPIGTVIETDVYRYNADKWLNVEMFLTWAFDTEDEIDDFKRDLNIEVGDKIHFDLVKSFQWKEVETYYSWTGMTEEEIQQFKRHTFFHYEELSSMFERLVFGPKNNEEFAKCGKRKATMKLFLRWFLTDEDSLLRLKLKFRDLINNSTSAEHKSAIYDLVRKIDCRIEEGRMEEIEGLEELIFE